VSRTTIMALACVALGAPVAVRAGDLRAYLQAGWALPADPPEFSDLWNSAASFGGGVGLRLAPQWELVGSLHVQTFAADEAAHRRELLLVDPSGRPTEILSMDGRDARIATLMGELRFHFPTRSRFAPFLAFGTGWFDLSLSPATFVPETGGTEVVRFPEETDAGLAASIGGGCGLRLSPSVGLLLDCVYTIGFTEGVSTQFLPLRLGIAIG